MKRYKKTQFVAYLVIIILFAGCSDDTSQTRFRFDNNNECISWRHTTSTVRFPQAHSGNYVCRINKDNEYSTILDIRVRDISDKPLKKARISAWFMLTGNASMQNLVFDVRDSSVMNSYEWINADAADQDYELNKWTHVKLEVDLTKKDRNNMNNVYRIYANNNREEPVYVDDFEVFFE